MVPTGVVYVLLLLAAATLAVLQCMWALLTVQESMPQAAAVILIYYMDWVPSISNNVDQ